VIDILILSNGPGEITTWVFPVVKQLRYQLGNDSPKVRISLVLSPCPHAAGNELAIASLYPEIDRIQGAESFFPFLLWGKTADNWDWDRKGMVIFLGGDQFYTLVIAKRLGYSSLVYAEWEARWYRYLDYFAVMNEDVINKLPPPYQNKCTIVGDLMADVGEEKEANQTNFSSQNNGELIGLLPGSKAAKLTQGVPFTLAIAQYIHQKRPETKFIIPVAPTINIDILAQYAQAKENPFMEKFNGMSADLIIDNSGEEKKAFLQTTQGLKVELISEFPCYKLLKKCQICLTTVGANTAQLGSLSVPMIVLIPSYQLDAMKSWDGLPGLLANLPLLGNYLAKLINWLVVQYTIKNKKLYAWPNIWAKKEIVPELIGELKVENIGDMVLNYLENPTLLAQIKQNLTQVRGDSGAAEKISKIVMEKFIYK
jgi:lipid-A-disaccharide synthase